MRTYVCMVGMACQCQAFDRVPAPRNFEVHLFDMTGTSEALAAGVIAV